MSLVIPSTSRTIMKMTTPPTGWTKDTSFNDYALRVTTGSVVNRTTGHSYSTVFKNYTNISCSGPISFSVGATSLSNTQMPNHIHFAVTHPATPVNRRSGSSQPAAALAIASFTNVVTQGLSAAHIHPNGTVALQPGTFINESGTPSSISLEVRYVDAIVAVRN
jgi:hypothetical protein